MTDQSQLNNNDDVQYLTKEKLEDLQTQLKDLKEKDIPTLAKRIDDAKQMGDLSENAEYHAAREEMAWAQSRVKELESIIRNAQVIQAVRARRDDVGIGSTLTVQVNGVDKTYTIVGAQEANPSASKISNESPLGQAFLGKKKGDTIQVTVPAGVQTYKIVQVR